MGGEVKGSQSSADQASEAAPMEFKSNNLPVAGGRPPVSPASAISPDSHQLEVHPVANLFPPMTAEEYEALKADIAANGLIEPITVWGGKIIDGRHRFKACRELGIPPQFKEWSGVGSLPRFIVSMNLHRRSLTSGQKAVVALEIEKQLAIEARERQRQAGEQFGRGKLGQIVERPNNRSDGKAAEQAAKLVGTNRQYVSDAKQIAQTAPELLEKVRVGDMTIPEAKKLARHKSRQVQLERDGQEVKIKPIIEVGDVTILCADARDLVQLVEHSSFQLVVTSPPYNQGQRYDGYGDDLPKEEYVALLSTVFSGCYASLVDGGRVAVVVPIGVGRTPWVPFAPRISDILVQCGFTLRGWCIWNKQTARNLTSWGSFRSFTSPHFRDGCEVIIVGHKGSDALVAGEGSLFEDERGKYSQFLEDASYFADLAQDLWTVKPETELSDVFPAPFPVELAERLIRLFAYPGASIMDPFAGSGTVGVAAQRNGCRAVLLEQSPRYCALIRRRLEAGDPRGREGAEPAVRTGTAGEKQNGRL